MSATLTLRTNRGAKQRVNFQFNSTAGLTAWAGQKTLKLTEQTTALDLPQGIHQITLAIDRQARPKGPLSIQLQDAGTTTAQTRLVMGQ